MNFTIRMSAVLLAALLVAGLTSPAWAFALPLEPVMPNLTQVFAGYDLQSEEIVRVLVELDDQPVALMASADLPQGLRGGRDLSAQWEARLTVLQDMVTTQARLHGIKLTALRRYTLVHNGLLLTVPLKLVPLVSRIPGVKAIWPDEVVSADLGESVSAVRTPSSVGMPDGYDGAGIVVAILDTGIDYFHPDLGGGIGPGFKVVGGWDFVDDDDDPMEQKNILGQNASGRDFNTSHGTHVAAIVADVAPRAQLLGIRVLGRGGSGSIADVMSGIEYAVKAGAHVANLSLGAANGHPDSPWARSIDNAVSMGVVFVVSNGNGGSSERTVGTYASARLAISVGNADATLKTVITASNAHKMVGSPLTFSPPATSLQGTLEYVDCGLGIKPADFRDAEGHSKVLGKVALILRGEATFAAKSRHARDAGAVACIIYNNIAGPFSGTLSDSEPRDIPTFAISGEAGSILLGLQSKTLTVGAEYYNTMAPTSSRGPDPLLNIKPDICAPGTSITAAFPFPGTDGSHVSGAWQKEPGGPFYGTMSGTSMAAPHVAGGAAILLQANPHLTPAEVKATLMNTSSSISGVTGEPARPIDQGAGMIDIARATAASLRVQPGSLSFKEVGLGNTDAVLNITNLSTEESTYTLRVAPFNEKHDYSLHVAQAFTVGPSASIELPLTLAVGASLLHSTVDNSNYCGYIYLENSVNPSDYYRVPYQFWNKQIISQITATPYVFSPNGDGVLDTTTITFTIGSPVAGFRLLAGAATIYQVGALEPGVYSFAWDGKSSAGMDVADGFQTIHGQYRATSMGAWLGGLNNPSTGVGTIAYGRVTIDRVAPNFWYIRPIIDVDRPGHIYLRGSIDDLLITNLMQEGGSAYVNGKQVFLSSHADLPTFQSPSFEVDLHAGVSVNLQAADRAGNVRSKELVFPALAIDGPLQVLTNASLYTITGAVIPGMTVTVNGKSVPYSSDPVATAWSEAFIGRFSADVPLAIGTNTIEVVATVPSWSKFEPLGKTIEIRRTGFALSGNNIKLLTGEEFQLVVSAEAVADLCGVDFELTYNPTLLALVDIAPGSDFVSKNLFLEKDVRDSGVLAFKAAIPQDSTGFSGSGPVAVVTMKSRSAGISDVTLVRGTGVNRHGLPTVVVATSHVSVVGVGYGRITGNVELPGRYTIIDGVANSSYSGATVSWNGFTSTTDEAGNYEIIVSGGGTHSLTVHMPSYIAQTREVTINGYSPQAWANFVLTPGDVNGDGYISLADFVLLADAYGAKTGEVGYLLGADVNGDGVTDGVDLHFIINGYSRDARFSYPQ